MEYVSGVTVPKLNQGNLREIPIAFPPLSEQERIVSLLDEAFASIDKAKSNLEKKHAALDDLRNSLMDQAFSGRLIRRIRNTLATA